MRFPFSLLLAALPLAGISVSPTVAFSAKANEERASLSVQPQTLEELRLADPLEIAKLDKYDSRLYDIVTPIKKQQARYLLVLCDHGRFGNEHSPRRPLLERDAQSRPQRA